MCCGTWELMNCKCIVMEFCNAMNTAVTSYRYKTEFMRLLSKTINMW